MGHGRIAWRRACLTPKGFAVFVLIAAALWALTGLVNHRAYRDTVDGAQAAAANLARSLAEYEASSVRTIDFSLIYLRDEWLRDRHAFAAAVQRHAENLARERVIQVAVLDAEGTMVFSRLPSEGRLNFADREYFQIQRERGADDLYVSVPVFGRVTKQWAIQFTRPVFREGRFAGLIIVAVPPPALEEVYRDIELGRDGVITLVRNDGQILARTNDLARRVGVSLAGHPSVDPALPPAGSFRGTGVVDGVPRFISYRRLKAYPLTIIVGQSVQSVLAGYRRQRDVALAAAAMATVLVYALVHLFESRARDRKNRQRLEAALVEGERRLLEERERVMLELHDGTIQSLYALGLQIENCRRLMESDPAAAARAAERVQPYLSGVIQDMRAFLAGEKAPARSPAAFVEELSHLVPAASAGAPRFTFDIASQAVQALSAEQAAHVLRIAGEAASNVVRHAQAKTASVSLKLNDGLIELEISDDGAGLAKPSRSGALGLNHIRARAEKLGGRLRVDAAPGRGTRISVAFPPSRA